jgi:phosphatidylglycerophosphate synthase
MTTAETGWAATVQFIKAARVNEALTASLERRVLGWMAARMPRWVTPDGLTLLGLAAQGAAGLGYWWSAREPRALLLVMGCVAVNWFGDSMDGTLARYRREERPRYGFYVDHMVDCFGALALMGGLAASGYCHWETAIAMLVAFLLLGCESYLATYTLGRFQLSQGWFGPTEIRVLLVIGNAALLHSRWATVLGHRMLLFDLGGVIAAVCMVGMAAGLTARHAWQLYREEPVRSTVEVSR